MAAILTIAFAFGSAVYAFDDKFLLVGAVLIFYIIVQLLIDKRRKQKYLNRAVIHYAGKMFSITTFMDSGNRLIDPETNLPVCIISTSLFVRMGMVEEGHYIDYQTIGGKGKIFVFRPDKIDVGKNTITDVMLGVSLKDFGKFDALLNAKLGGVI